MSILHKNARSVLYIKAKAVAESAAIFARIFLFILYKRARAREYCPFGKSFFRKPLDKTDTNDYNIISFIL